VLPHASRGQTNEVIEAILRLFPDTGAVARTSEGEPYLTLLDLSQPINEVDHTLDNQDR
jgi:hypothetical protein